MRINFITYQNQTIKDVITYCLSVGANLKSPPFFFMQRLLDNTGMFVNQFSENPELRNTKLNQAMQIKTNVQVMVQSQFSIAHDIISNNCAAGVDNIINLKTTIFHDYNHNKREWGTTTYQDSKIADALSLNKQRYSSQNYLRVFTSDKILHGLTNRVYLSNYMHGYMYKHMRNLILGSDTLQLNIGGSLDRDCGQFINLNVNSNFKIAREFDKQWQIYQCAHIWQNQEYYNDIICFRTCIDKTTQLNMKAIKNSKGGN